MQITPYHARYLAMLLSRRVGETDVIRYLPALMSANIDLHPHQIDAALFACRSQFQDGVILADEEGLGKTIEAGIVLKQAHIEGKANLLVLCPVTLIAQWRKELDEKFGLTTASLDKEGDVALLSYSEAQLHIGRIADIPWDLCVLDEAHQLANAGLGEHVLSDNIREALMCQQK